MPSPCVCRAVMCEPCHIMPSPCVCRAVMCEPCHVMLSPCVCAVLRRVNRRSTLAGGVKVTRTAKVVRWLHVQVVWVVFRSNSQQPSSDHTLSQHSHTVLLRGTSALLHRSIGSRLVQCHPTSRDVYTCTPFYSSVRVSPSIRLHCHSSSIPFYFNIPFCFSTILL